PAAVTTAADLEWASRQSSNATTLIGSPPPARMMVLAGTFYPGVRDASAASVIAVEPGSEHLGLNIPLQYVAVSRISGTALLPDGQAAPGGGVSLTPSEQLGGDGASAANARPRATIDSRGRFELSGVEAGRFVLTAEIIGGGRGGGLPNVWARQDVTADGRDLDNLVVRMQPKVPLTGRVIAAEDGKSIDMSTVRIALSLRPVDGPGSPGLGGSGTTVTDGSFTYPAITPWSYTLSISISPAGAGGGVMPGWAVSSVTLGGLDIFDKSFDVRPGAPVSDVVVTLTNKAASLSGRLTDAAGRAATEYFVVLVPADRVYWASGLTRTPRAARPATDGTFRFDAVTPGEYFIAASTGFDAREAADPAVLEPLIERGTKVTIGVGATAVQDLRIK
ncbi:MAG TPA: carboxypeptidase-like regulatory domain-containing protein, partial [Vicinamibacterales bacterium]|nr:carboxypeptidase-like regulatory domain-containing protein [Vicinamibacterales bacterium]